MIKFNFKKSFCVTLSLFLLVFLIGCQLGVSEDIKLLIASSYAVPGVNDEIKGESCSIIEEDKFGRILFSREYICDIAGDEKKAIMICQKYTDDCVYFYEDICYMRNDISDEKIATLKKLNDWNLPLDYGKMSSRKFNTFFESPQ